MQQRSLGSTIKNLVLAMINATLILLALCIWLAWQVSSTINTTATDIAKSFTNAAPLKEEIASMTSELASLRQEIATMQIGCGDNNPESLRSLKTKIDALDQKADAALGAVETIATRPEELINLAIDAAARKAKVGAQAVLMCDWESS